MADLFNDWRKSKENRVQADVCRLSYNVVLNLSHLLLQTITDGDNRNDIKKVSFVMKKENHYKDRLSELDCVSLRD